jgi:hypothetical protein
MSRRPDWELFTVRKTEDGKEVWTKVGVQFASDSGKSIKIFIDALPLSREIVGLPPKEKKE